MLETELETKRVKNPSTPQNFLKLVSDNISDPSIKLDLEFRDTVDSPSPKYSGTIHKEN